MKIPIYRTRFWFPVIAFLAAPVLRADDIHVWAEETGGNVVFHFQGAIDTAGFPTPTGTASSSSLSPASGAFVKAGIASVPVEIYNGVVPNLGEKTFGTGEGNIQPVSATGDVFGFTGPALVFGPSYASGTLISGSMTFIGESLSSLGVNPTPKSFDTTIGTNTIYLFTNPNPVAPPAVDNSVLKKALKQKIKKLAKKAKSAKKKGQSVKAKKLGKKVKKLKVKLLALG